MTFLTYATLLGACATMVSAHGRVTRIVYNGVSSDEGLVDYTNTPAKAINAGWATKQGDLGFTSLSDTTGSIICAEGAVPGTTDFPVTAGDTVDFMWDHPGAGERWPVSHHGPTLTYLAKCPGTTCAGVTPSSLQFFKIQELGLVAPGNVGTWASDSMIVANGSVPVVIPKELPDGAYVARHETIALHSAGSANGAQFYPQCVNLKVTGGSGTLSTDGVAATALYSATDPGILINIYQQNTAYPIPGPKLRTTDSGNGSGSGSASSSGSVGASSTAASAPATTATQATPTTLATSVVPAPSSTNAGGKVPLPSGATLAELKAAIDSALDGYYSA
ncbi:lytic polysaccharide monooxygenase [Myriangium duriaei CBS 260.36]|uniref:Lytic polysaccharide monooxygenase n=1 Tax=Myriangium duriaei CBS 260.36 TaxID=1168546 RepID=A0A9P4MCA1_9PEZI|nr:lytic polysaccharide monooxygenase [Myriangium duriaei CBS 260.36]